MSFDLQPTLGNEEHQEPEQAPAQASGFATLGLADEILRSVIEAGYTEPTDVQARAIPAAISGVDLLVSSRTGSGKTAAFVLPALQRVIEARRDPAKKRERGQPNGPRVLVRLSYIASSNVMTTAANDCVICDWLSTEVPLGSRTSVTIGPTVSVAEL